MMLEKFDMLQNDFDNLKGDYDAKLIKIEYLEGKLEQKYHLEGIFTQLKGDYEELRAEKQELYDKTEQTLLKKNNDIKLIFEEKDDVLRENGKLQKIVEENEMKIMELIDSLKQKEKDFGSVSEQQSKMERAIENKQERIE